MKTAKLSEFYTADDEKELAFIWTPLLKAMAIGVEELFVTPDEFVTAMRYAIPANIYHEVVYDGGHYPTILAMRISIMV